MARPQLPTLTDMVSMELHVQLIFPDFMITRVPGGWIYSHFRDVYGTSTFVPIPTKII